MSSDFSFRLGPPPRRTCKKEYKNYSPYKKYLAEDFGNRCGYCDAHHFWGGGRNTFHIDHFAPKAKFPELETSYSNLVYSCSSCNLSKSDDWVSDESHISSIGNRGYIDPCHENYDSFFSRDSSGNIIVNNNDNVASYMYNQLAFYLQRHKIIWNLTRLKMIINQIYEALENSGLEKETSQLLKEHLADIQNYYNSYLNLHGADDI